MMNRHIPPNSSLKRCLFPVNDAQDVANAENYDNLVKEQLARDKVESMHKWGLDIENETPIDGPYVWTSSDGRYAWIGRRKSASDIIEGDKNTAIEGDESMSDETLDSMKDKNEVTPTAKEDENNIIPALRKRRKDELCNTNDKGVKRKIIFD